MEASGQIHAPAALIPGKHFPVPMGRPQSRYGRYGEEKISLTCGQSNPDSSVVQSVA
jgi:hypothetical protein